LVLANTEELQDQIETLRRRVRELENELHTSQASSSNISYPLQGQGEVLQTKPPVAQDYGASDKSLSKMEEEKDNFLGKFSVVATSEMGPRRLSFQEHYASDHVVKPPSLDRQHEQMYEYYSLFS
jgi:hypothetical protein